MTDLTTATAQECVDAAQGALRIIEAAIDRGHDLAQTQKQHAILSRMALVTERYHGMVEKLASEIPDVSIQMGSK